MNFSLKSKNRKKASVWIIAALFLFNVLFCPLLVNPIHVRAEETLQNSLKFGDMTSTKGFAIREITEPQADDYYISFDYMYPSGQNMSSFSVWRSFDGVEYDDTIITQTGGTLLAKTGSGAFEALDITVEPDVWYNFAIHCKSNNTFEVFIDGRKALIGSTYSPTQIGTGRMKAIGNIGDISTADHNGCGYFDNYRIITGSSVIAQEDFNSGSTEGWTFYSTAALSDPPVDCQPDVLDSVELSSDRTGLLIGHTSGLNLTGTMSGRNPAVLGLAEAVTYQSSNASVATVETVNNAVTVTAVGEGTATITASVTMNGVTKTSSINILVTSSPVLYTIRLAANRTKLLEGDTEQIIILGEMTDGSLTNYTYIDAISFQSTDTGIIAVNVNNGVPYAAAVGFGSATVNAVTVINNVERRASLGFDVLRLDAIALSSEETTLFAGNNTAIDLSGTLTDGNEADLSLAETINFQSSDNNIATVDTTGAKPLIQAVAPGHADITATVTLRGITKSAVLGIDVIAVTSSKTRSTYYTTSKVNAARQNVLNYDWAKSLKDAAVANAETYLQLGYDFLWNLVTPQSIARSYAVNQPLGCPNCGKAIDSYGNYPYIADPVNDPWKLECPNCHMKFPTNDFGAYYESGLDEHRIFNPRLADKSLLINVLYPEKGVNWGVDDGYGYKDENGKIYTIIAYYNHWGLWYKGLILSALNNFRDAYVYTGDPRYARAGIILLDRIADVYPDMDIREYKIADGFLNSNGNSNRGKVVGSIWETGLAKDLLKAYDAFFPAIDDPEVINFLSGKSDAYILGILKKSAAGIKRNIEDGIVRQIYPGVKSAAIKGNNGMHQSTLALAAVVMDTLPETTEWLDFDFMAGTSGSYEVTGGNILATLVDEVDRDGHGNESAPGYNRAWLSQFLDVADILYGYDLYPSADLYNNAKFKKMFSAMYPLMINDIYSALIGDSGCTGNPINYLDKGQLIKAFEKYGDPVLAQVVYFLNNNDTVGLHSDVLFPDPEGVASDIENVIDTYGQLKLDGTNLTGYGFTALRDGEKLRINLGITQKFPYLEMAENSTGYTIFESSGTLQFEGTQAGDYITFRFEVAEEDMYEIDIKPYKAPTYGKYSIKIDGQYINELDFFGGGSQPVALGSRQLSAGIHTITFESIGKNEASSGYKMGVILLSLLDQQAQALKAGNTDTQRGLWMYYGRNRGHGHADTLNIGFNSFWLDLMSDLGYPEYADATAHRLEWVSNTVSHNTVLVDKIKQGANFVAQPLHYDNSDYVKLIDVQAPMVYPQTQQYRRTTAMIKVDDENSYAVDFFRVTGGSEHHFSFHAAEAAVTTEGLDLVPQVDSNGQFVGTYAGTGVEFGVRPAYDSVAGYGYVGPGFHWLKNVEKDTDPPAMFSVDWNVKDTWNIYGTGAGADTDTHLRLTMLGDWDDVALTDGVPPRNKPGNPKTLKYVLVHRQGQNLDSLFTSVIEPYKSQRYIATIAPVSLKIDDQLVDDNSAKAIMVIFDNGRVDYIINALDPGITYTVADKFQFKGFFGVYSEKDSQLVYSYINNGKRIGTLIAGVPSELTGTVRDFTRDMSLSNEITVQFDTLNFTEADLLGRYIYVSNDGERNASYQIKGVKSRDGSLMTLDIGDVTTIRSWIDPYDYSKGYVYDFAEGAQVNIPLSKEIIVP